MPETIKGTVKLIDENNVILSFSDGQILKVPSTACEGILKEGAEARLIITAPGSEDAGRQALARELLNEILSA